MGMVINLALHCIKFGLF